MIDYSREKVYLAALLHDIGKFYQRADSTGVNSSDFLSEETKKLEDIYCPVFNNIRSHKHVLWTAQFIESHRSKFKELLNDSNENIAHDTLVELACSHHLPKEQLSELGNIIRLADHLSAGMDRSTDFAYKDEEDANDTKNYKNKRMVSVFEAVLKDNCNYKYHLPVCEVSLSREFFPKTEFSLSPDYLNLWKNFVLEFESIKTTNIVSFNETLLSLLWKYTSRIPSSTIHLPDVSLFDHSKTTAAFAISLYDWQKSGNPNDDSFLLIGADLSGIQNYIYNIISYGAARNLKGRSFYLQLLLESVLQKILIATGLHNTNVVYNSGGGFYVLAPNTPDLISSLEKCKKEIENAVFSSHNTELFVAIDYITLSKEVIFNQAEFTLGQRWAELTKKVNTNKQHRYADSLISQFSYFFEPAGVGGTAIKDAITLKEFSKNDLKKVYNLESGVLIKGEFESVDKPVKELTYKQFSLGKKLKQADFWIISHLQIEYWKNLEEINPAGLGIFHYFISEKELMDKKERLQSSADCIIINMLNWDKNYKCNFIKNSLKGNNNQCGLVFYGGNDFPVTQDGNPKTFDQLAGEGEGLKRIGVLRMDIDNLGYIFKSGFTPSHQTFSRYSAVSRDLDWFFKGYLNTIWSENQSFKESIIIIYSGGDDLFIVGKWNVLMRMAEVIRKDFNDFTCNNPNISLSGGMAVLNSKFPIQRGALESEYAEKLAKTHLCAQTEKNAFAVFGLPFNWDIELPVVVEYKERIIKLLKDGTLPKSFIGKIIKFAETTEYVEGSLKPFNALWMMAYDFGRMANNQKNDMVKNLLDDCKNDVFSNTYNGKKIKSKYHMLQFIHIAARWAELELRSINN